MLIRNIDFTDDPQGLPATGFQFYIGLPNTNPQEHANRLQVFNGKDGEEVSNPFFVDQLGRFINGGNSSTVIKPWVNEQEYSILVFKRHPRLDRGPRRVILSCPTNTIVTSGSLIKLRMTFKN